MTDTAELDDLAKDAMIGSDFRFEFEDEYDGQLLFWNLNNKEDKENVESEE